LTVALQQTDIKRQAAFEAGWQEFRTICDELGWDNRLVRAGSTKAAGLFSAGFACGVLPDRPRLPTLLKRESGRGDRYCEVVQRN
jgi:hypothetical protein